MKVVIIGGGIAGLTLGIFLRKNNIEVVINERLVNMPERGHAFLMHSDGLSKLKELSPDDHTMVPGKMVHDFILKRPSGKEIKHLHLDSWKCIKRGDLIRFLKQSYPCNLVKEGREFSHFIYENDKITAAAFSNGELEYGDIFVGADGGNSKVRQQIMGEVTFSPVAVKEVVGVSYNEKLGKTHGQNFTKFQDNTKGLAFGMIPTDQNEFVWFIQYDANANDVEDQSPEGIKAFCSHLLKDFPAEVNELLSTNDFTSSYIWNTRDFDLLPKFHHENVVLTGDAAHLSLPFTSAGTTNAIVDARTLADELMLQETLEQAFEQYYATRAPQIEKHILLGRELKHIFLNPTDQNDDDIPVPLIVSKEEQDEVAASMQIDVLYFTDPICSTCWTIQPLLRKLKLEYGSYLNIKYCMGGMLPSWGEYPKGKVNNPGEVAKHWDEVCAIHEMPIDGDLWIEDPMNSSYPPSIAFKAAQMQDNDLAPLFLRRINEMVFVEKKNIIKWEFLETAALEVGLDSARLLRDFEGRAKELFTEDLNTGKTHGVTSFPTLIFSDQHNEHVTIKGHQTYDHFVDIILKRIPHAKKAEINTDPKTLFSHFPTMADKEFAYLSNISMEAAAAQLEELYDQGFIKKMESKNGTLWKSNYYELI
ncbi:DsbA family protein [Pedobacter gandavensis]|uniref:DsbA family protein n=1 Tax=Pedobacter gandavensis TaxID=2679963 RepID=UPI00247B2CAC|nr:DsbA family protein [Pedobacter gandavensis]WGQ10043.1 DsbA family protein [Pedobacter gandavensis]